MVTPLSLTLSICSYIYTCMLSPFSFFPSLPPSLSSGVWEYIESIRDVVRDLEKRVTQAKTNVETMTQIMSKWSEQPLYQRKEDKKDCLLNLDDKENTKQSRYGAIKQGVEKILELVKENMECFKAQEDTESWRNYIDYIDDIILDGLFNCIHCSLKYLSENTSRDKEGKYLFKYCIL